MRMVFHANFHTSCKVRAHVGYNIYIYVLISSLQDNISKLFTLNVVCFGEQFGMQSG